MLKFNPTSLFRRFIHSSSSSSSYISSNYINCNLTNFLSHQSLNFPSLLESHAFIIVTGNHNNVFFASKLISFYSSLSNPQFSTKVFDSIQFKDPFLWNSVIKSHFSNGNYEKALEFFLGMRVSDTIPNNFTVPMVVTACAELSALGFGVVVYGLVAKLGFFGGNSAVGSSFVYFYSKCGRMGDAQKVFDEMGERDVVAWTALVIGYLQNGESERSLECLCLMHRVGGDWERPNYRSLEGGFQACGNVGALREGRCLHGFVVKNGYGFCYGVQSSVLSLYSKWGILEEACRSFCEVGDKDLMCWTSIIAAYARLECVGECLSLFWQMQDAGIVPDVIVPSSVLSSFADPGRVHEGKAFHGVMLRRKYALDQVICRALMSMYCRFGLLSAAEKIFYALQERNSETWKLMISEYGKAGMALKCLLLFRDMLYRGIEFDSNSLVSVIASCSQLGSLNLGKSVHCYVTKYLLSDNVSISNSLLDMYGKSGKLAIAKSILGRIQRDTVTWNTLISACVHSGEFTEALAAFDEMIVEGLCPNTSTLATVVSACSHLSSLEQGMKINNYISSAGIKPTVSLTTALVDMYGKCGQLEMSREIFDSMEERDAISWNVMISCYGMHGEARSAIEIFKQMEESSIRPNDLTFLAVLLACSHGGLAEEGKHFFRKMQDYSITPSLKHYTCIIDLLGKSGHLQEAEDIVKSMPMTPDGGLWGALLNACKLHSELEIGKRIAKLAIEADPGNDGYYIALSNMLESTGEWKEAEKFRELMKEKGVRKRLGWSAL